MEVDITLIDWEGSCLIRRTNGGKTCPY
jgi:hypothetical protein